MAQLEPPAFDDRHIEAIDSHEKRELALFQWLSSLERELLKATRETIKPHQELLEKKLLKYIGSQVVRPSRPSRQLVARCLIVLYHRGDPRTLFDTLAAIQSMLANKKLDDLAVKLALIHTIGALTEEHGTKVMSLFAETTMLFIRTLKAARDADIPLRYETIRALTQALKGAGRGTSDTTLKDLVRIAKNGIADRLPIIKQASSELLMAIYQHTHQPPPLTLAEFEALIASIVKSLDNSTYFLRRSIANLIAAIFAIALVPGSLAKFTPKRPGKPITPNPAAAETPILSEIEIFSILSNQFVKATSREVRVGIFESVAAFLRQSGSRFVESQYSLILKFITDIISNPKAANNRTDAQFIGEACAFLLRDVVGKMLTETGQANGVREIVSSYIRKWPAVLATDVAPSDQTMSFLLYELAALLKDLGPAANDCQEGLSEALLALLSHPSPSVKVALACTFRALCSALPNHITPLLSKLIGLVQKDVGLLPTDYTDIADRIIGYANAISAITSILHMHPLYTVYEDAAIIFGFSAQLLKSVSNTRDFRISVCQSQVAWTLIGALMSLGHNFVRVHLSQLLLIWKTVFPKMQPKDINANRNEADWMCQLASREAALAALHSFLVFNSKELCTSDVGKRIVVCLNNTLHFLSTVPSLYGAPAEQASVTAGQARLYERECLLRKRLFECFSLISPTLYETVFPQLITATVAIFALDPDRPDRFLNLPGTQPKDASLIIESVMPTSLVDGFSISIAADSQAEDRGISKIMIRDTDLQGLECLISRKVFGSLENDFHALYLTSPASSRHRDQQQKSNLTPLSLFEPLPSPFPSNVGVVDAALELFSLLFPLQNAQLQESLIESVLKSATFQGGKITPMRKTASQINSLASVVGLLKYVMVKRGQLSSGKVSVAIRDLVDPFLRSNDAPLRSIASEILGRLARVVGTATFVNPMLQALVDQVINNREPESRAGSALALGCIHSFVGGMAASSHLSTTVGILHSLASDQHPLVHTWALHSLWLTIESAGLMYGQFVNPTLTLVVKLFMSESHEPGAVAANTSGNESNNEVLPAFGRILHALVGIVGPELQMSDSLREICFSLYEQLKNDNDPFVVVEAIRCIQNFILFARKYMDIQFLIPFLQRHLSGDSRAQVYQIRKASVTCLYQLTQHDPETVLSATINNQLEEQLFALLDVETEEMVRDEIKDILTALLRHMAPGNPSRWIDLCRNILAKAAATDHSTPVPAIVVVLLPRWRTQLFALQCLHIVTEVVLATKQPEHLDMALARTKRAALLSDGKPCDFLVFRLPDLIRIAFNSSTANVVDLRLAGLLLLRDVIERYALVPDPDYEDHQLLEQYQAQVIAALAPAFSKDSSPEIISTACSVSAFFISVNSDIPSMGRLLKLLGQLLDECSG
eukprot:jgi/Hompol1/5561/HPOL_004542-RA